MSQEQLPEDPYRTFGRMVAHIFALAGGKHPEAVPRAQEALHAFVGQAPEAVRDYLAYFLAEVTRQLMEATGADPKRYLARVALARAEHEAASRRDAP